MVWTSTVPVVSEEHTVRSGADHQNRLRNPPMRSPCMPHACHAPCTSAHPMCVGFPVCMAPTRASYPDLCSYPQRACGPTCSWPYVLVPQCGRALTCSCHYVLVPQRACGPTCSCPNMLVPQCARTQTRACTPTCSWPNVMCSYPNVLVPQYARATMCSYPDSCLCPTM